MEQLLHDTLQIAPLTATFVLALVVVLINTIWKNAERAEYAATMIGLIVVAILGIVTLPNKGYAFGGMIMTGGFASFMAILFSGAAFLSLGIADRYIHRIGAGFGEFYMIIIFALMGMIAFASGTDLIVTFVGLELLSISLYILAGITRRNLRANEASLKYFLLGAFATGFFLYGIALIYGSTGTTNIIEITRLLPELLSDTLFMVGVGLLLVGFAFKIGAVPFHMWIPDVYEGAPTAVPAFMSTGAKASAFGALLLVFTATFEFTGTPVNDVFAVLAIASMVIGNVVAIAQNNVKRLLAYSSIAHAGYMLIGLTVGTPMSLNAVVFYLISYTLTNIGAFGIVSFLEDEKQTPITIRDFYGLGTRKPFLGILMSIFMFSLIGIPPLSGFFGKYYIFVQAIENGYTWLTIVGVLTSVVSVYYYLRVVTAMYFNDSTSDQQVFTTPAGTATLLLSALGIILLGIGPQVVLQWMSQLF